MILATLTTPFGSVAAVMGAVIAGALALRVFFPGAIGVFNFQRSTIEGLKDELSAIEVKHKHEVAELRLQLDTANARILELEKTHSQEAVIHMLEQSQKLTAALLERHEEAADDRNRKLLGLIDMLAAKYGPEPASA